MLEAERGYRPYIAMFLLNLAVVAGVIFLLRREEPRVIAITTPGPKPTATIGLITVHVSGAVKQPGAFQLPTGSRVADALQRAGGVSTEADVSSLNLARALDSDETIIVNARPLTLSDTLPSGQGTPAITPILAAQKLNINTATAEELDKLPGIGPTLSQRIVEYRNQNGPFKRIEELKNVRGIGDKLLGGIKDLITVE